MKGRGGLSFNFNRRESVIVNHSNSSGFLGPALTAIGFMNVEKLQFKKKSKAHTPKSNSSSLNLTPHIHSIQRSTRKISESAA